MNQTKIPFLPKILLIILLVAPFVGVLILGVKHALLRPYQTAPSLTPDNPMIQFAFMAMVLLPFLVVSIAEVYLGKKKLLNKDFTSARRLFKGSTILSLIGIILVALIILTL